MSDHGRRRSSNSRRMASSSDTSTKSMKDRKSKKPKERWLLTRKTWRYMADAGRKLIPDGALNRPEDLPKIEAYFQEVCQREPRFLLWRKSSYPGALSFKSHRSLRNRKGGSCKVKSSSADESEEVSKKVFSPYHISGGRFDIQKMKQDFLNKPVRPTTLPKLKQDNEENQLVKLLGDYLNIQDSSGKVEDKGGTFDYSTLVSKLQQHLHSALETRSKTINRYGTRNLDMDVSFQKTLSETLNRYLSKNPNRQHIISDILTDRKMLEKLYFDLRQTKRNVRPSYNLPASQWRSNLHRHEDEEYDSYEDNNELGSWKRLGHTSKREPPPLIEIQQDSQEQGKSMEFGIQTEALTESQLRELETQFKQSSTKTEDTSKVTTKSGTFRRKSSIDNDDVSQSVSDTIKRYLRMARKKSVDSDKVDRFKRLNYDKNLRFIKAKGEHNISDDDDFNKGCQTNDDWITCYRELKFDELPPTSPLSTSSPTSGEDYLFGGSSRSSFETTIIPERFSPKSLPASPPSPSGGGGLIASGQSFLSNLLHGSSNKSIDKSLAVSSGVMQKSKSSSSVGSRLVSKKIWRSRSKSQTRATPGATSIWMPQGQCTWTNVTGRKVVLQDTTLLHLSEVERRVLQKVALAKLQALNLRVTVRIPTEKSSVEVSKPKRKAYLLKRKALTTSFFDNTRSEKGVGVTGSGSSSASGQSGSGLVFGIPLNQCIVNDRLTRAARGYSPLRGSRSEFSSTGDVARSLESTTIAGSLHARRQSHHGSRTSFSSLVDTGTTDDDGSCENLLSRERIGTSVPGLLDTLSSSTSDLTMTLSEEDPGVPQMVTACLKYLETNGMHTLGIFRVSSSKKRVRQLREDFDSGKMISIEDEQCPHDVATLLKEYLRDLPDPLLCRDLYQGFIQTQKIRNRRLQYEALQYLVQLLPAANRDTLYALINFLANIAHNSSDQTSPTGEWIPGNKMDSSNLATVFAPNILHCIKTSSSGKESNERPEDRVDVINVIRSMIDHNKMLFHVTAELLDEVYTIMMESDPEALDELLVKRVPVNSENETPDDLLDSETSTPRTPNAPQTIENLQDHILAMQTYGDSDQARKIYTREEFLHGTAGMGGPNLNMRVRHKDRERDRFSKRRWRDDSTSRKQSLDTDVVKSRSSSMDSGNAHESSTDSTQIRVIEKDSRRQSTPLFDHGNIITASLKIPIQSSILNPDSDIPFIEDSYTITSDGRQQMPIGILRNSPTVPPRRQRVISTSESDSSIGQPISGSLSINQGYDSAVGSSATFSTAPRNTPSDIVSPPSWTSTPPTSPDSTQTIVNYIPDVLPKKQESKPSAVSAILQKVKFTSAHELLQKPKQVDLKKVQKCEVSKSASTPTVVPVKVEQKFSPSISNIGGAVLRSRTADFERFAATKTVDTKSSDKKKYVKRRYTDSRHQTRHIPDAETLTATSTLDKSESDNKATDSSRQSAQVFKRRELIASVPKEKRGFL